MKKAKQMSGIRSWNAAEDGASPLSITKALAFKEKSVKRTKFKLDNEAIIYHLEKAGATLLALRLSRPGPIGIKTFWPEFVRQAIEAYGYNDIQIRPAMPGSQAISHMDLVFEWLGHIPQDRFVVRRIVGARALVSPITQKHLYSWMRLAKVLGADRRGIVRWHEQGIAAITKELAKDSTIVEQLQARLLSD